MKKWTILLVTLLFTGMIFWSCSGDDDSGTDPEPENVAPTCEITTPAPNTVYNSGNVISVEVNAEDSDGEIVQVCFHLDSVVIDSIQGSPYNINVPTSDLTIGEHVIRVVAEDNRGAEAEVELPFTTKLQSPSDLQVIQNNVYTFTLSWTNNNPGADGSKIERKIDDGAYTEIATVTGSSYVDSDVLKGYGTVYYQVRAYKDVYYSDYAIQNSLIEFPAPTNLIVEQVSEIEATLTWDDNSVGEEKFEIERKLSTESIYMKIGEVIGDDEGVKTWSDLVIEPCLTYDYRINGVKGSNSSSYTITTYENRLHTPEILDYIIIDKTAIEFTWTDNSDSEDGYKIDKKTGEGAWVMNFATVDSNITSFIDYDYDPHETYFYRVRAFYQIYTSYNSEELYVSTNYQDMITTPSGNFEMGVTNEYSDQIPVHNVHLTHQFYMSKFEVTNQEYCDMLNYANIQGLILPSTTTVSNNNSNSQELLDLDDIGCKISYIENRFEVNTGYEKRPVMEVTWYGSVFYCNILSRQNALVELYDLTNWSCNHYASTGYRLPTESEWEYVARYNDVRKFPWGYDFPTPNHCNFDNNVGQTTNVGYYSPLGDSNLGLCDMSGNLYEWCNDWYGLYLSEDQTDPLGFENGTKRVYRGGCYNNTISFCTTTFRGAGEPYKSGLIGFRIVQIP